MRRREFIALLGGAAAAWPIAARAQQPAMPVIGWLNGGSPEGAADRLRAFRQGLSNSGYVEGRNIAIEYRWAQDQYDRLPSLADDLLGNKVSLIAAGHNIPAAQAAKSSTATIPIVFMIGADPIEAGLVASLNRPGGNLTGATSLAFELLPKRLQLLHELVPKAHTIGLLVNPTNPSSQKLTSEVQAAAVRLGLEIHVVQAITEHDFDSVFTNLALVRAGGLVIAGEPLFTGRARQLGALTLRHAIPAIYQSHGFAAAGGLMSYGSNPTDASLQGGIYAGRILKGEKPADLPVLQPTKFELFINLKTAKALGLTVPPGLLALADEVIE